MNRNTDAALKGLISGFTTSLDNSSYGFRPGGPVDVADSANRVASNQHEAEGNGEGTDYITGANSGTRYGQITNDRSSQLMVMLAHTANNYIDTGDVGEALNAGSQAVQLHNDTAWRASKAGELDDQGYDPIGIQTWIASGDNKDLVTGAGQMIVPVTQADGSTKNVRMDVSDAVAWNNRNNAQNQQAETHRSNVENEKQGQERLDQSQKELDLKTKQYFDSRSDVQNTTDLGDRTLVHFKDGTESFYTNGVSPDVAAKQADQNKLDRSIMTNIRQSGQGKALAQVSQKHSLYQQANSDLEQYDAAMARGDKVAARQIATQAQLNVSRGEVGGNASIDPQHDNTLADRNKVASFWNDVVLQLDGRLSAQDLHAHRTAIEAGLKSTNETLQSQKSQMIDNYAQVFGGDYEKAERYVNAVIGGDWTNSSQRPSASNSGNSTSGQTKSGNRFTITGTK